MYAPKFMSWLTAWDRLDMQIDRRAEEYKAEIHAMAASAKAEFAEPEPSPDLLRAYNLANCTLAQMAAGAAVGTAAAGTTTSYSGGGGGGVYPAGGAWTHSYFQQ